MATAITLLDRDYSVLVIDNKAVAGGASGAIAGMINPATGRRATKVWRVEQSYPTIRTLLDRVQQYTSTRLYESTGVLRPAQTDEMYEQMLAQYEKTDWPDNWVSWLDTDQMERKHPGIHCIKGGLWISVGLMVRMPSFLQAMHTLITTHDYGELYIDPHLERSYVNGRWIIKSRHLSNKIYADHVIDTKGFGAVTDRDWDWLPLHPVKGQLLHLVSPDPLPFTHSISSLGYMARYSDHELIVGSTYEHHFTDTEPTIDARPKLFEKVERTLPKLAPKLSIRQQWSGVRISSPQHKPILGNHPKHPSLSTMIALGSKGLLYCKYGAELLVDHILDGTPIPNTVSIQRLPQSP
jgi:glycine/D-amino acid oxidase-like deaminating enzyme